MKMTMTATTKVEPFIKCVDYWPDEIPQKNLRAYKSLIDEGQIVKHHVMFNERTGSTTIEYYSIAPHEWILEELKRRCNE